VCTQLLTNTLSHCNASGSALLLLLPALTVTHHHHSPTLLPPSPGNQCQWDPPSYSYFFFSLSTITLIFTFSFLTISFKCNACNFLLQFLPLFFLSKFNTVSHFNPFCSNNATKFRTFLYPFDFLLLCYSWKIKSFVFHVLYNTRKCSFSKIYSKNNTQMQKSTTMLQAVQS